MWHRTSVCRQLSLKNVLARLCSSISNFEVCDDSDGCSLNTCLPVFQLGCRLITDRCQANQNSSARLTATDALNQPAATPIGDRQPASQPASQPAKQAVRPSVNQPNLSWCSRTHAYKYPYDSLLPRTAVFGTRSEQAASSNWNSLTRNE